MTASSYLHVPLLILFVLFLTNLYAVSSFQKVQFRYRDFFPPYLSKRELSPLFLSSSPSSRSSMKSILQDLPHSVERLYKILRQEDTTLKGLVLIPLLAFSADEHDQIMSTLFEGCDFQVIQRDHLELVLENSRFFPMLPYIFEKNILINLRLEPEVGRDDLALLSKFYKYILKRRDVLDALEKQNRLGTRQDLDHIVVFYFNENHASDHMVCMPLRHPVDYGLDDEDDEEFDTGVPPNIAIATKIDTKEDSQDKQQALSQATEGPTKRKRIVTK